MKDYASASPSALVPYSYRGNPGRGTFSTRFWLGAHSLQHEFLCPITLRTRVEVGGALGGMRPPPSNAPARA